jgi:hypothetical protein
VTAVTFRGDRLAVTPVELDSVRAKQLRAEIPEALYESGKSQLSVRVPSDPVKRFPALIRAADVLLAVKRGADDGAGDSDRAGDDDRDSNGSGGADGRPTLTAGSRSSG